MSKVLHSNICSSATRDAEKISKINLNPTKDCPRCKLNAAAPKLLDACKAEEEADNYYGPANVKHEMKNKARELRNAAIALAEKES